MSNLKRAFSKSEDEQSSPHSAGYELPKKASKRGTLTRENHVLKFNEEDIMKRAAEHEKYSKGGISLSGLPKFDDLKNYGIAEKIEKHLWRLEIRRLMADATSSEPLIFHSKGILGKTDLSSFEDLSNLADQIVCNMAVIEHDNALHVLEHCRWIGTLLTAVRTFKESRTRLMTRYEQDEDKVKARRPKTLNPPENNQTAYFALVDYITSSVARVLVRSATSDYWNNHSLAILAKWAAKLKVLSYKPTPFASLSIESAEELLARLTDSDAKENVRILKIRTTDAEEGKEDMDIDSGVDADITGYYFQDHIALRAHIANFVHYAAFALYASEKTGNPADCFEVCTLVYGLERNLTVISNDRRGDVSATSDRANVTCSYTAFQILMKNAEYLKARSIPPNGNSSGPTTIRWQWSEGSQTSKNTTAKADSLSTSKLDHLVSILIPFSLTDTHTGIEMGLMLDFASGNSEEDDPILQFERKHFNAKFVVTTATWGDKQHKLKFADAAHQPDADVLPVSGSPLNRTIRAGTKLADLLKSRPDTTPVELPRVNNLKSQADAEKYKQVENLMNDWIVAETSVTLKCHRYVYGILSLCTFLVCGAMAVPFSLGSRLPGVDPFDITTFAWVVAGFLLVLAKSRYVCEWPWHDFLRGRVVCQSIKDIAEVSGIEPQMILTNLLHNERNTTLITKGPYNGMFERRAESGNDGFSIDVPIHLSTMLASGFVLLKVLSVKGERLICLDVRKGSEWGTGAAMKHRRVEYLTCTDLEDDGDDISFEQSRDSSQNVPRNKVLRLRRIEF